jgi:hypothetical protein
VPLKDRECALAKAAALYDGDVTLHSDPAINFLLLKSDGSISGIAKNGDGIVYVRIA